MSRTFQFFLTVVAGIVGLVLGVYFGLNYGESSNRAETRLIAVMDPHMAESNINPIRSGGGFTGFEGLPSLTGEIYRTGEVEVGKNRLKIYSNNSLFDVDLSVRPSLFRISNSARPITTGDTIMLRFGADGEVAGILILPNDLHDGSNRRQTLNERNAAASD